MKNSVLWIVWAVLYIICALLGVAPLQGTAGSVSMTLLSLVFFLPGSILVYRGFRQKNPKLLRGVRIVSIVSLSLTLIVLIANFFSVLASESVGNLLQLLLTLVSAPMICSGYWIVSLFLWACLLMSTLIGRKKSASH